MPRSETEQRIALPAGHIKPQFDASRDEVCDIGFRLDEQEACRGVGCDEALQTRMLSNDAGHIVVLGASTSNCVVKTPSNQIVRRKLAQAVPQPTQVRFSDGHFRERSREQRQKLDQPGIVNRRRPMDLMAGLFLNQPLDAVMNCQPERLEVVLVECFE